MVDTACAPLSPYALHYGGCPNHTAGMSFLSTPDPNLGGNYRWVQIVSNAMYKINGNQTYYCPGGLDNTLPYNSQPYSAANSNTQDSSGQGISQARNEVAGSGSFSMYLFYQPPPSATSILYR